MKKVVKMLIQEDTRLLTFSGFEKDWFSGVLLFKLLFSGDSLVCEIVFNNVLH